MTSRFPAASDRHESAANAESSATARIGDEGPYARPAANSPHRAVDAVLIDAIRASVGPFVPAPWRTVSSSTATPSAPAPSFQAPLEESVEDSSTALPWIESFMDAPEKDVDTAVVESSDPASVFAEAPDAEVSGEVGGAGEPAIEATSPVSDSPEAPISDSVVEAESASINAEEWPLEEAGAAMRALADDLVRNEETPASKSEPAASDVASPDASTAPLGMWSDDDMMDIMPVKTPVTAAEGDEQWAARARRETQGAGNSESAAQALEALARRVRSGEIQLPVFSAEMGEAAALAAALAALLGARR